MNIHFMLRIVDIPRMEKVLPIRQYESSSPRSYQEFVPLLGDKEIMQAMKDTSLYTPNIPCAFGHRYRT